MSGVCVKHDRYVQAGEVCPYCEPEGLNAALPADSIGLFGFGPVEFLYPIPQPSHCRLVLLQDRDRCPDCGKSGQAIMAAGETYTTHVCLRKAP